MRAAVLRAFGDAPQYEELPDPVAADGEVVVEVCAASLKPVDKQMASGSHYARAQALPVICGTDGVGRLADGQRSSSAVHERLMARWRNAPWSGGRSPFRYQTLWMIAPRPPSQIPAFPPGCRLSIVPSCSPVKAF